MALIQCDFFSESLGFSTTMNVILPQPARERYRVLYLLHGMSDDHTIWCRRTSIERYVDPLGLAVVMPAVHRGYYTDMAAGYRYWTFISEELPALARSFFPLSHKREDTFVAGLSMGGALALRLAEQRGADVAGGEGDQQVAGSSPLARGGRPRTVRRRPTRRLIPARAGRTRSAPPTRTPSTAHPRSRGADRLTTRRSVTGCGSSPLARGGREVLD